MKENNPLSPHIQIYNWHVSSLVSISHRITGILNYFLLIFICIWAGSIFFGEDAYGIFKLFLNSLFGKFFVIGFKIVCRFLVVLIEDTWGDLHARIGVEKFFLFFGSFVNGSLKGESQCIS